MTQDERNILKESIKGMVRESIFDLLGGGMSEKKNSEKKHKKIHDKLSHEKKKSSDKEEDKYADGSQKKRKDYDGERQRTEKYLKRKDSSTEDPGTRSKLKRRIIQYLKDEKTDIAPYAYELWPDKDEDSARSYFYRCLDNKTNDEGDVYSFSDDEFNRLHSMITDRSMKK